MPVRQVIQGVVPVKVYTNDLDPMARKQLENLAQLPFIHHHVAANQSDLVEIVHTLRQLVNVKG